MGRKAQFARRLKLERVLIFGESSNDCDSLAEIALAIKPSLPTIERIKNPPILRRDINLQTRKRWGARIAQVTQAAQIRWQVTGIIAHRDCDEVEPAHVDQASSLAQELSPAGVEKIVVATPAFELEAWWYLWPDAVAAVRPCWRALNRNGQQVGKIKDAKETLTRELRPFGGRNNCPDYRESDSVKIAKEVRAKGIVHQLAARSSSFEAFRKALQDL